jgi:hypothetical protein
MRVCGSPVTKILKEQATTQGLAISEMTQGFVRLESATKNQATSLRPLAEAQDLSRARGKKSLSRGAFARRFPPTGYAETSTFVHGVSEDRICRVEEGQCPSSSCSPPASRRWLRSCWPPAQAESSTRSTVRTPRWDSQA